MLNGTEIPSHETGIREHNTCINSKRLINVIVGPINLIAFVFQTHVPIIHFLITSHKFSLFSLFIGKDETLCFKSKISFNEILNISKRNFNLRYQ